MGRRRSIVSRTALSVDERVGAGGQVDGDAGGGLAVELGRGRVILVAELDPRDVAQPDPGAVGLGPQQDVAELLRRLQVGLGR